MEWNMKWDWENLVMFSSKASEKKLQLMDWAVEDEGELDAGSFNLSGGGAGSGGYGSDMGHGSSAKSSVSASTDSSPKEGMKTSNYAFQAFEGSPGEFSKKTELVSTELSRTSPPPEAGSTEPVIGLKLGKRTYFENNGAGNIVKSPSVTAVPVSSAATTKKTKSSCQDAAIPRCQVEGCNVDLSSAKEYHRKHRVCDNHSKCPKVTVGGLERRFCQQCSRFHSLSEFDEKKRSCRRRLSDHNARRRKPQQETIHFNSARLSSPFYDSRQQLSFMNHVPLVQSGTAVNSIWESTYSSKFTLTKGFPVKPDKVGGSNGQMHVAGIQLPHAPSTHSDASSSLLMSKATTGEIFTQGFKESTFSSNIDAAPEFPRALSLLSTNSWGSCEPESVSLEHPMHVNQTSMPETLMHAIPQGLPLASSEYWQTEQQSSNSRVHALATDSNTSSHFQEIQLFKAPYETDFYFNAVD